MPLSIANANDIPALVTLINSAYRGEASKQGWTTEADLLKGELRTDATILTALIETKDAVLLKYETEEGELSGCVYLHQQQKGIYLGMLTVSPLSQGGGIGKQLLKAADEYALKINCPLIFMHVISLRYELINWYKRHGYYDTGSRKPFPADQRFGVPTQPLEFMVMEKSVSRDKE